MPDIDVAYGYLSPAGRSADQMSGAYNMAKGNSGNEDLLM